MSLFRNRDIGSVDQLLADRLSLRTGRAATQRVTRSQALRHSAVWACLRLRADITSTLPTDVFKRVNGIQVEAIKPPVLVTPGGSQVGWEEWCYSTQVDLDSTGNTVGVITARDGLGLPAVIELQNIDEVTFRGKGSRLTQVRVGRDTYAPQQVWHEKQFTVSGLPIGLSPIAHAAMTIQGYLSAQEFAGDWFGNSTVPGGHLKNTQRTLKRREALRTKQSFKDAVGNGDVWVSGVDWEYKPLAAKASDSAFIEQQRWSVADICRFLGVPGDMIDADTGTGSITYANITQRNLQFLILHLNPALVRREAAISRGLLPQPRYMKFNRDALLQMDMKTRWEALKIGVDGRWIVPSEIRDLDNKPPFTPEQLAEFQTLFPNKAPTPAALPPGGN